MSRLFINLLCCFISFNATAEDEFYTYITKENDTVSNILWSLGIDNLYGNEGNLKKYLKLVDDQVGENGFIREGQEIRIPKTIVGFKENIKEVGSGEIEIVQKLQTKEDAFEQAEKEQVDLIQELEIEETEEGVILKPFGVEVAKEDDPAPPPEEPEKKPEEKEVDQRLKYTIGGYAYMLSLTEENDFSESETAINGSPALKGSYFYYLDKDYKRVQLEAELRFALGTEIEIPISPSFATDYYFWRLNQDYEFDVFVGFGYDVYYTGIFTGENTTEPSANTWYGLRVGAEFTTGILKQKFGVNIPASLETDSTGQSTDGPGYEAFYEGNANPLWKDFFITGGIRYFSFEFEQYNLSGTQIYGGFEYHFN